MILKPVLCPWGPLSSANSSLGLHAASDDNSSSILSRIDDPGSLSNEIWRQSQDNQSEWIDQDLR